MFGCSSEVLVVLSICTVCGERIVVAAQDTIDGLELEPATGLKMPVVIGLEKFLNLN